MVQVQGWDAAIAMKRYGRIELSRWCDRVIAHFGRFYPLHQLAHTLIMDSREIHTCNELIYDSRGSRVECMLRCLVPEAPRADSTRCTISTEPCRTKPLRANTFFPSNRSKARWNTREPSCCSIPIGDIRRAGPQIWSALIKGAHLRSLPTSA